MTVAGATGATRGTGYATIGAFNAILKEYYRPSIRDQLNSKTALARKLQRRSEGVEGKYMVTDLNVGRNYGYGYIAEGGALPDPQAQQTVQARYAMRFSYGRIKFTGPSAAASRGDRGSFIRIMDYEIQGLTRDIQHNDNRVMFGDGTGRLCCLSTDVAGTGTYLTTNPGGITSTALGTQYLAVGMRVCTVDAETDTIAAQTPMGSASNTALFIKAVDYSTGVITLAATSPTGPATDFGGSYNADAQYLYLAANTTPAGTDIGRGYEPNGLAAIISDADPTFQSGTSGFWPAGLGEVAVASYPIWKSPVIDNDGTPVPFSFDMLQQGMDLVDQVGDGTTSFWITSHGIRRQALNILVAGKRYVNTMEMDGGYKAITYNDKPIIVDKDATRGRIYGIDEETIFLAYETDYDWIDQDGSVLHRIPDQDSFQACMYRYWNLCCDARNRNVLIADVLDP